jgi:hypothetical protein
LPNCVAQSGNNLDYTKLCLPKRPLILKTPNILLLKQTLLAPKSKVFTDQR